MTITDDEREAREWLKSWASSRSAMAAKYGRTILALLDAPRMPRPEDVPPHVLEKMLRVYFMRREEATDFDDMRAAYRALYDHYTAPPPKVEAWALVNEATGYRVYFDTLAEAQKNHRPGILLVKLVEDRDGE